MYVQCVKCLWEGYEAPLEIKPSGKSKPMTCPECGKAEIVDRETVSDFPDELPFELDEDDLEYGHYDGYDNY